VCKGSSALCCAVSSRLTLVSPSTSHRLRFGRSPARRHVLLRNGSASNVKAKVASSPKGGTPPKYQHPKTGATWTGHGRAPAWLAEAKERSKFLIVSSADVGRAASNGNASKAKTAAKKASKAVAGAVAHKGQRKGPQPAKYLDPKTGATWSGRGPAPAWLAAAKDRTKFLIAGAAAVASETSTASKASKPRSSAASGAVEKKAATKKIVAKKAVTKKVAPAGKAAPAKKVARKRAAVTGPAATVATGAGSRP